MPIHDDKPMTALLLAAAESAVLISIYKPILLLAVVTGWGRIVGFLDKDLHRLYLKRRVWNGLQIGGGAMALLLWLVIPYFWIGLLLALIIFAGTIGGYAMYRNTKVDAGQRWTFSLDSFKQRMDEREHARAQRRASTRLLSRDGMEIAVPSGDDPNAQAHIVFERLLEFALPRSANRIELAAEADKAALAVRVDGVSYPQPAVDPRLAVTLIEYLRQHAGMDMEDRRRKQRGLLPIEVDGHGRHQLSVAYAGSTRGLNMIVEIDQEKASLMLLEKIGLLESQRQQLEPALGQQGYAIIIACPPHQGLTTTMVSLVNRHDPFTQSVMTLEEDVEIELEGVMHEKIDPGTDPETIERRLASILRSDPAVVMLSKLGDAARARLIAEAARDVRFYFGMRYSDSFTALKVWLKSVGDDKLAARALGAIVAQRLVRKLCPTCRLAYQPDPDVLRKLNLPPERVPQLYKHSGKIRVGRDRTEDCPTCLGMGYRGRIGIFETMVLDDEARKLLAAGRIDQFRALLRRKKMLYLQETALLKVVEGLTSISEITRALSVDK